MIFSVLFHVFLAPVPKVINRVAMGMALTRAAN